jgi:hypothetical protein
VTVEAEQLPVASIWRIVMVVVILVMDGELTQPLAGEFTPAPCTDPRQNLKGSLSIGFFKLCSRILRPHVHTLQSSGLEQAQWATIPAQIIHHHLSFQSATRQFNLTQVSSFLHLSTLSCESADHPGERYHIRTFNETEVEANIRNVPAPHHPAYLIELNGLMKD